MPCYECIYHSMWTAPQWRELFIDSGTAVINMPVSKIWKNIYRCDVQATLEFYGYFRCPHVYPNKTTFIKYFLLSIFEARQDLWNALIKAVPSNVHGSGGHSKRKCLQDRANFRRSRPWQIVLIFNALYIYAAILLIHFYIWYLYHYSCIDGYSRVTLYTT